MRISDWSSDVCSSDLMALLGTVGILVLLLVVRPLMARLLETPAPADAVEQQMLLAGQPQPMAALTGPTMSSETGDDMEDGSAIQQRSEEHTSELQSLMRISYAVFCLKNNFLFFFLLFSFFFFF